MAEVVRAGPLALAQVAAAGRLHGGRGAWGRAGAGARGTARWTEPGRSRGAEISELSAALMNTARKDWMTLENLTAEMPLTADFGRPPLPAFGGRVRCRSIYDAAAMDDPVARRVIQACADAGEQARLLPRVA